MLIPDLYVFELAVVFSQQKKMIKFNDIFSFNNSFSSNRSFGSKYYIGSLMHSPNLKRDFAVYIQDNLTLNTCTNIHNFYFSLIKTQT